jgi:hypothetical protein
MPYRLCFTRRATMPRDDPQVALWLSILASVVAIYVVIAVVSVLRPVSPALTAGAWFGVAAGVAWLGEIWFQAPARLPANLERPVGGICALIAAVVTVAAGISEGVRTGRGWRAVQTGLWAGLVSGSIMAAGIIAIQLSNLGLLGGRADYQAEFARSAYPDMATYLASDAVAASLMHMVLNVVLGLVGGGIGAAVALARPRTMRATVP